MIIICKKITTLFISILIIFSTCIGCSSTPQKDIYDEFVEYLIKNGTTSKGEYKLIEEMGSSTVSICLTAEHKIYFEEIMEDSWWIFVDCEKNSIEQKVKSINFSTTDIVSTAKINPATFSASNNFLGDFYVNSAPLGKENARALLSSQVNLLLMHISMLMKNISFEVSLSDLGYKNY